MKIAVRVSLMRPLEESSGIQGAPGGGGEALNPFQPPPARRGSSRARHRPRGAAGAPPGGGPPPPRPLAFRPLASGRGGDGPRRGQCRGRAEHPRPLPAGAAGAPGRAPRQDRGVGAVPPRRPSICWVGSSGGYGLMLQPSSSRPGGKKKGALRNAEKTGNVVNK